MEPLNEGLGGLALEEVEAGKKMGMAPKKNEAKSDIVTDEGSYKEGEMGGNMEESGDVKSNTSMGKVNKGFGGSARASNTEDVSAENGSLVEKGKKEAEVVKDVEEKERAPSICSCEWDFYHSRNLHAKTSMERQKK